MYDHRSIEQRWQKRWSESDTYRTPETGSDNTYYALVMFPYPSGDGLHVGHARVYIGADIHARMKRMQGYRVLHPMGWDAFGLPAEEYAIRNRRHPRESTERNIGIFKKQCIGLGLSYDWDREINTTDPSFYRWTQYIFLLLFRRGLAYESTEPVNWCPSCKTGLANEDLEGGKCERCGSAIERKPVRQWMLRITEYADRLLDDLALLDGWSDSVKEVQRNWIGRSDGYEIPFRIRPADITIDIFTTRPDTLYGCSFIALSPENPVIDTLLPHTGNADAVAAYRTKAYTAKAQESEKEKTGVPMEGVTAVHPVTGDPVPVFVADFVLGGYGTGAIFGSPAHDERDFEFATRYNLPVTRVIDGDEPLPHTDTAPDAALINSGEHTGTPSEKAKRILTDRAGGKTVTAYRLQDWVFSRQRYWGEPIPLIRCGTCGVVPVPEKDLPVVLPEVESYEPTGTGESPLAAIEEWVNVPCPKCGTPAKRETNTMPQWAGSSWYQLRYTDPHNTSAPAGAERERRWMPVDVYTGGMEHAARHLIYARFWHKVLHDAGAVSTQEPYRTLRTVGIVQAEGGGKMSKRSGNVVNPMTVAEAVGADALRVYIAHIAPFSQTVAWNNDAIAGARRFLERVYALRGRVRDTAPPEDIVRLRHKTILSVTRDIESYRFNTAVSALMVFANALQDAEEVPEESYSVLIRLLAPFAPHLTEEIWESLGNTGSVHHSRIPDGDESLARGDTATVAVQVRGRVRGTVSVPRGGTEEAVLKEIAGDERLADYTRDRAVKVFIADRIISFV